jgi:hypothetical protein
MNMNYFQLCNSPGVAYAVAPRHVAAFREQVDGYCECPISEKLAFALATNGCGDAEGRWELRRWSPKGSVRIHPPRESRPVRPLVPGQVRLDAETARARVLATRAPRSA